MGKRGLAKLWSGLLVLSLIWGISFGFEWFPFNHAFSGVDRVTDAVPYQAAPDDPAVLSRVGFVARNEEPTDEEVKAMVNEAILQVLGPEGLAAIVKPGDKVVIKVNNVGPYDGSKEERGRGVITDPRIVRYIAEKVRAIIGFTGMADLKVVDAGYSFSKNPSSKTNKRSFYWAHLEKDGDGKPGPGDVCYDLNADGILDGDSKAQLINLDSIDGAHRFPVKVKTLSGDEIIVCLPKFLRTKKEAGDSEEYCDVLIGLPIFKSHGMVGVTGAIKLHYGFRRVLGCSGDTGRLSHSGLYWDATGIHKKNKLLDYLCAEHQIRTYDFILMDCLTGNRRGPESPRSVYNEPVDYLLTHAMLAAKDPVAIDTVEAAFAGYDPRSVDILETCRLNGLGTNDPGFIQIVGLTDFGRHRRYLYDRYYAKALYPFQDGWGGARTVDITASLISVKLSEPSMLNEGVYSFKYAVQTKDGNNAEPARIDFLLDGKCVACRNQNISNPGEFRINLSQYPKSPHSYRIAVWDNFFNCTLTEEMQLPCH